MLDDEILKLRKELDESIKNGADYAYIYELSTKLDELITKYYKNKMEKCRGDINRPQAEDISIKQ